MHTNHVHAQCINKDINKVHTCTCMHAYNHIHHHHIRHHHLYEPQLPRAARVLDGGDGGGTGAAVVAWGVCR